MAPPSTGGGAPKIRGGEPRTEIQEMPRRVNLAGAGSESAEQRALVEYWRMRRRQIPGEPLLFAIPNGGRRDAATGARLKAEGALAGVPDLLLAWPAGGLHGLFIELKRANGGRPSKAQNDVMASLQDAGYAVVVAHGWKAAAEAIEAYLAS